MTKQHIKSKKGFTIIEVVLVLAIAGLILLMAIMAFPRLQKTTYDTQRKDDMDTLVASLMNYESSNRGVLPSATWTGVVTGYESKSEAENHYIANNEAGEWGRFYVNYILTGSEAFLDPDGTPYNIGVYQCGATNTGDECVAGVQVRDLTFEDNDHTARVVVNAKCDGDRAVKSTGPRQFAVLYRLEINGTFCAAN